MNSEEKEKKGKYDPGKALIEGCIDDNARAVIDQMLERRLAELDAGGQQATFIMELKNQLGDMPTCKQMFSEEKTEEKTE